MCTSIVTNLGKTVVGFNLDILDMEHKVTADEDKVCIMVFDSTEGWLPLFGANCRGDFVAMPTCHPYDNRSDPKSGNQKNIIIADIDLLLMKKSFEETLEDVKRDNFCSVPGITFQSQLSDKNGNVLQIVPGQGYRYFEKPEYSVLTNFSPFKGDREKHPWMGLDRYEKAVSYIEKHRDKFGVEECFGALREASQTVCPTVVSIVFDVSENTVYYCENREWDNIKKVILKKD